MSDPIVPIAETDRLDQLCRQWAEADYITVDTEFLRENTYYPKLCLIQIGGPDEAHCIDPLAAGLDLAPLHALMRNERVLKVFHSARQDVEIFLQAMGTVPAPMFDTQIAAMVCGFGESVSYETLVIKLAGAQVDKTSRFTDWSRRPLSDKQLRYALADVTHLRPVYEALRSQLAQSGRLSWLDEEMAVLANPATYLPDPVQAWTRIKTRSNDRRFLAVLRELAAWREIEARKRDIPRGRMLRDETLLEIATQRPTTPEALGQTRGLARSIADGWQGTAILAAVERAIALPPAERPKPPAKPDLPSGLGPVVELLRVLLKMCCDAYDVAPKMIAHGHDLDRLAADDDADIPALKGWRREVFGNDALRLKRGEIALKVARRRLEIVEMAAGAETDAGKRAQGGAQEEADETPWLSLPA